MANYVIILEHEGKIINYWYSQITGQTLFNMAILESLVLFDLIFYVPSTIFQLNRDEFFLG